MTEKIQIRLKIMEIVLARNVLPYWRFPIYKLDFLRSAMLTLLFVFSVFLFVQIGGWRGYFSFLLAVLLSGLL